jgi:hypothetical protein
MISRTDLIDISQNPTDLFFESLRESVNRFWVRMMTSRAGERWWSEWPEDECKGVIVVDDDGC